MARKKKETRPDPITLEDLRQQITDRRIFWHPARVRMDLWHLMTILVDIVQLTKPAGTKRFIGAEPHATIMLARSILARNQLQPHIPLFNIDDEEERGDSQDIERLIIGGFNDIDRVLWGRGMQNSRSIAALHLLIRGWAVSHLLLREDHKAHGMSTPIDYEAWDMRYFLPVFDRRGFIQSCAYESFVTWAEVLSDFPDLENERGKWKQNMSEVVSRFDWYDELDHAVAIQRSPTPVSSNLLLPSRRTLSNLDLTWAKEPTEHGLDAIPVVCIAANGLPFNDMPSSSLARPPISNEAGGNVALLGNRVGMPVWRGRGGHVADWGRSILAAVEDLVPQYNETVALLSQILYN
ncbi:hypothetical protein LCGC14_2670290, partial [marine sediment metagenome]